MKAAGLSLNSAVNGDQAHPDTGKPARTTQTHIQAGLLSSPLQCVKTVLEGNSSLCIMLHLTFLPWLTRLGRYYTRAAPNYQCPSTHNSLAMQSSIIVLFEMLHQNTEKFEDIAVDKWRHRTSNGPKAAQSYLHRAESSPCSAGDLRLDAKLGYPVSELDHISVQLAQSRHATACTWPRKHALALRP